MQSSSLEMERKTWNKFAMFLLIVLVAALLPTEVSSSSLPRALFRYRSSLQSKRSPYQILTPQGSLCKDARDGCESLIRPHSYMRDCATYKGQCDVTCGVDPCLKPLMCKDILHPTECLRAKSLLVCGYKLYMDACFKTCCECNDLCSL